MNKRGFIRTLEAVLAVILIFLFIFFIGNNNDRSDQEFIQNIRSLQESILDDISKNDAFRECIVAYSPLDQNDNGKDDISDGYAYTLPGSPCEGLNPTITKFISNSLPERFKEDHKFTICDPEERDSCTLPSISSNQVFTSAVIITSTLESKIYKPRVLRLWFF